MSTPDDSSPQLLDATRSLASSSADDAMDRSPASDPEDEPDDAPPVALPDNPNEDLLAAPPPEPVEDSAEDPIPEKQEGDESDDELEKLVKAEARDVIVPSEAESAYRKRRLSDPVIIPRLRRRFARRVTGKEFLDELIQNTHLRALSHPSFPRPHEPMFPAIYKPASASRKQGMREHLRRQERERPLEQADHERWVPSPDAENLSDRDAARLDLLMKEAKQNPTFHRAVVEATWDAPEGEASGDPAFRKRRSRMRSRARILLQTAGLLSALSIGAAALYYVTRPDRDPERMVHHDPRPTPTQEGPKQPWEIAEALKTEGLKACDRGDWKTCMETLEKAERLDGSLYNDPVVGAAWTKAYKELEKTAPPQAPTPTPPEPIKAGSGAPH